MTNTTTDIKTIISIIQLIVAVIIPLSLVVLSTSAALKLKYAESQEDAKLNIANMATNIATILGLIACSGLFALGLVASSAAMTRLSIISINLSITFGVSLLILRFVCYLLDRAVRLILRATRDLQVMNDNIDALRKML